MSERRRRKSNGGAEGDRTPDLVTASHALSQLSYSPKPGGILAQAQGGNRSTPDRGNRRANPGPPGRFPRLTSSQSGRLSTHRGLHRLRFCSGLQ